MSVTYKLTKSSSDSFTVRLILHGPTFCKILRVSKKYLCAPCEEFHIKMDQGNDYFDQLLEHGSTCVPRNSCDSLEKLLSTCDLILNGYKRSSESPNVYPYELKIHGYISESVERKKLEISSIRGGKRLKSRENSIELVHLSDDEDQNTSQFLPLGDIPICECKKVLLSRVSSSPESPITLSDDDNRFEKRGVTPIQFDSRDPLLTGNVTDREKELPPWPIETRIPSCAKFTDEQRLRILTSLKKGYLVPLTIHNISIIFDRAPSLSYSSQGKHICILCGDSMNEKRHLFTHIQSYHTAFSIECPEEDCQRKFRTEISMRNHFKKAHRKRRWSWGIHCCDHFSFVYNEDTLFAGLSIQEPHQALISTPNFSLTNRKF